MAKTPPKNQVKARFRQLFAESGLSVSKACSERLKAFTEAFDPTRLYPTDWWDVWLKKDFAKANIDHLHQKQNANLAIVVLELMKRGFCYSIPTVEAVADIAKFVDGQTITEYMAGSGYWAFLMRAWGVSIEPSDIGHEHFLINTYPPFVPLANVNLYETKVAKGPIMISWPPRSTELTIPLSQFAKKQKLIFICDEERCSTPKTHTYLSKAFKKVHERSLYGGYGPSKMTFYERAR